jgi:galactokinase
LTVNEKTLRISTPGRICLFGEHQDYLNLPVIAAAISKRVFIEGSKRPDSLISIQLPDIKEREEFSITLKIPYSKSRDYFRSSFNILQRNGFTFSNGIECKVHGEIPINTGTASSSALVVAWINFLTRMSDQKKQLAPELIADLAFKAEVLEFSEPGGMMDHYSTAMGGVIHLTTYPETKIERLNPNLGAFILGNSEEPKDTKNILARVKNGVMEVVSKLQIKNSDFTLQTISINLIDEYKNELSADQFKLLKGTILNKVITENAYQFLKDFKNDQTKFGSLLYKHQIVLRDYLKISTTKIDRMIDEALNAGAIGAKINGSGGGGCMFAYAPVNPEKVLEAVKKIAPDSDIVYVDIGTDQVI